MNRIKIFLSVIVLIAGQILGQQYQKTENGITTNINSISIEIKFYSPEIVRVLKSPEGKSFTKKSSL